MKQNDCVCIVCHGKEEKVDRNRFYEARYYFGVDLTSYQYINATFRSKFSCASLQVFTPNFTHHNIATKKYKFNYSASNKTV